VKFKNIDKINWKPFCKEGLFVIGVDEVGRGCLAGPVYAAAIVLSHHEWDQELTDSKLLSEERREHWARTIQSTEKFGIGIASVEEIEQMNILKASLLAMKRAIENLNIQTGIVLIDGNQKIPGLAGFEQMTFVKGDLRLAPISAASIVAKVSRDQYMKSLAKVWPQYGFDIHKGYGTPKHRKSIQEFGVTQLHRKTFSGVKEHIHIQNSAGSEL
jgi:ribonuclease HII